MLRAALLSSFLLPLLSAQVPLSQAVPADMHFVVHGMTSATPDPGWVRFERAVGMLAESGIHEDVLALATLELSPAERERVHAGVAHAFALLGRVDWALLTAQEVVFAYRIALPMPEYVAAFRVPAARAGEQLTAVREMLAGFAEFSGLPPGAVHEVERESGRTVVLAVQGIPVQFAAGTTGDVLVMATSAQLASTSLRLLQAGTEGRSFGTSERFLHGRAALPPASEDELFFDVRGLFDFYRQALRLGLMGASGQGEQARRSREVIDVMLALLDEFDVIDHVQSTTCCDGTTTTSVSRVCFVADFDSTPLAAAVGRQRPWSDWHRRVPVDASGFGFDGGIDLAALHDLVLGHLRESESLSQLLDEHRELLESVRTALGHVAGELAWVALPTPDGGGEWVLWLRLRESATVAEGLPRWLATGERFLARRGQHLAVRSGDGMHELRFAAFPRSCPVVGVQGDEFVLASSAAALARVDAVRRGEAASIRQSPAFAALGIGRQDAVSALAFGRVTAGAPGLVDVVAAAGFFLALAPAQRDTEPLRHVGAILTKLAPALRELDVGYDWGTETLPGGADTSLVRSSVRYHAVR